MVLQIILEDILLARIFPCPYGAQRNTMQLVKYPRVLSVKPSNKVYIIPVGWCNGRCQQKCWFNRNNNSRAASFQFIVQSGIDPMFWSWLAKLLLNLPSEMQGGNHFKKKQYYCGVYDF